MKELKMRELKVSDLFPFLRMIDNLKLRDELIWLKSVQKDEEIDDMDVVIRIISKAVEDNSEKELFKFLARLYDCTPAELEDMDLFEFLNDILKGMQIDKWKAFFKSAVALITKK